MQSVHESELYFVESMDVNWGEFDIVECELDMLRFARSKQRYSYYHLISGQDFPLKPIQEINEFYNKSDCSYVLFGDAENAIRKRYGKLTVWVSKKQNKYLWMVYNLYNWLIRRHLITLRLKRLDYGFGSQWFDITDELAEAVTSEEAVKWFNKNCHDSCIPDELFLQSFINYFGFKDKVHRHNMRYIDFERNNGINPYIFRKNDYEQLISSGMNFARKFDETVDDEILDMLEKHNIST